MMSRSAHNTGVGFVLVAFVLLGGFGAHAAGHQEGTDQQQVRPEPAVPAPIEKELKEVSRNVARRISFPSREELASVPIDDELVSIVDRLDHPVYLEREAATLTLLKTQCPRRQLYALLARKPLSDEQRHRLLSVVGMQLLAIPRGALGIRFNPPAADQPGEVVISDVVPGLPAERVLQRGDRITHVDGVPLRARNALVWEVQSKRPGESVELVVRRPRVDDEGEPVRGDDEVPLYDTLTVDIVLAPAELLNKFNTAQRQQKTDVERAREAEVLWAASLFGPRPKMIEVSGS